MSKEDPKKKKAMNQYEEIITVNIWGQGVNPRICLQSCVPVHVYIQNLTSEPGSEL